MSRTMPAPSRRHCSRLRPPGCRSRASLAARFIFYSLSALIAACAASSGALALWKGGISRRFSPDRTVGNRHQPPARCAFRDLRRDRQCGDRAREPLRARLRPGRKRAGTRASVLRAVRARHESRACRRRRLFLSRRLGIHVAFLLGAGRASSTARRKTAAPARFISSWPSSARWR